MGIVLVLSEAMLVLVIDITIILRAGLAQPIELPRHPSQYCDDPMLIASVSM